MSNSSGPQPPSDDDSVGGSDQADSTPDEDHGARSNDTGALARALDTGKIYENLAKNTDTTQIYSNLAKALDTSKIYENLAKNTDTTQIYSNFAKALDSSKIYSNFLRSVDTSKIFAVMTADDFIETVDAGSLFAEMADEIAGNVLPGPKSDSIADVDLSGLDELPLDTAEDAARDALETLAGESGDGSDSDADQRTVALFVATYVGLGVLNARLAYPELAALFDDVKESVAFAVLVYLFVYGKLRGE